MSATADPEASVSASDLGQIPGWVSRARELFNEVPLERLLEPADSLAVERLMGPDTVLPSSNIRFWFLVGYVAGKKGL